MIEDLKIWTIKAVIVAVLAGLVLNSIGHYNSKRCLNLITDGKYSEAGLDARAFAASKCYKVR